MSCKCPLLYKLPNAEVTELVWLRHTWSRFPSPYRVSSCLHKIHKQRFKEEQTFYFPWQLAILRNDLTFCTNMLSPVKVQYYFFHVCCLWQQLCACSVIPPPYILVAWLFICISLQVLMKNVLWNSLFTERVWRMEMGPGLTWEHLALTDVHLVRIFVLFCGKYLMEPYLFVVP